MLVNNYKLYKNNELIAEGTSSVISKYCGLSVKSICQYSKSGWIYDKVWKIVRNGTIEMTPRFLGKEENMSDEDYLLIHLKTHGRTTFNKDPKQFIKFLRKNGIEIKYKESIYKKGHYILEVVNANKTSNSI